MSEFNGRKFYGFSLHNDPALTTTTRNFEFRYTRPEALERAIQKVQLTDGPKDKQKKNVLLNKYCKPKGLRRTDGIAVKSRDIDVETQLSRIDEARPLTSVPEGTCPVRPNIRKLSDNEIEKLIGKAKSTMEMVGDPGRGEHLPKNMRSTTTETEEETDVPSPPMSEQTTQTLENVLLEIFCQPQPQWVEIEEASKTSDMFVSEVKAQLQQELAASGSELKPINLYRHLSQMQTNRQQQRQLLKTSKSQPVRGSRYSDKTSSSGNANCYYVEDSDYEYEMMGRSAYTKFCGPRPRDDEMTNVSNEDGRIAKFIEMEPRIPCMDLSFLKNSAPIRYTELTDEIHEEEPRNEPSQVSTPTTTSTSTSPLPTISLTTNFHLHSTSQNVPSLPSLQMKVFIKNLKTTETNETVTVTKNVEKKVIEKKVIEKKPLPKENTSPPPPQQHKTANPKISKKQNKKVALPPPAIEIPLMRSVSPHRYMESSLNSERTPRSSRNSKQTPRKNMNTPRSPRDNPPNPSRIKVKNIILSKSIEELKMEKMAIFNKMTSTQERIIELLDKLRLSLLEIYVPDSSFDKSKRQKNAFEFSVRFSRNFLYPLKGMIDDVRTIPKEHFNSSASNDACSRVSGIYALMTQALTAYQKQLRFFLLDQVPQKLTTLIEMIHTLTHICLEKGIFDHQDPIIECLVVRCTKFMGFLEDMHEERFLTARDNYSKTNSEKAPAAAVHTKYDLKMFMNDLNMYEPKLVPKSSRHPMFKLYQKQMTTGGSENSSPRKRHRNSKPKKTIDEVTCENNSSRLGFKGEEECVRTLIQGVDESSELLSSVQNLLSSSNDILSDRARTQEATNTLNKAVIEALQLVTKEQVRKVLEPIIQTLGTALDKKNNSETIEAILKALNKKSFPTKQNENIKRHDTEKIHSRSKVSNKKATKSTILTQKSTNALKASQQTKNRSASKKRESKKAPAIAATDDDDCSAAGTFAGARGGVDIDSDTASETESEVANVLREIESENDSNYAMNQFNVQISKKKRIEALQQQEERLKRRREQILRHEQFEKHLQYQKQQYQRQQQHYEQQQQQHYEQQQQQHIDEQQHVEKQQHSEQQKHIEQQKHLEQQKHIEQQIHNQLKEQEDHQEQQQQHHSNPTAQTPTTHDQNQQKAAAVTKQPSTVISGGTIAHRETPKHRSGAPGQRFKQRLLKKKRNPLLPPPPAPTATPLTSARTPRSVRSAARFSYMTRQSGVEVEEIPYSARTSQRLVTHTDGGSDDNNVASGSSNKNCTNMTSPRNANEALEALTATIHKQRSADTETVAAAAAIAAALGSANFTDNEETLNLLQSSVIVDVLAKCFANTNLNDHVTDNEDEENQQTGNKRATTDATSDFSATNNGDGNDVSSCGGGGDHHEDMYLHNPTLSNQQKVHMQQLQKEQQLEFQRNQLMQQILELQNIPHGQSTQPSSEANHQQYRQELLSKLATNEQQSTTSPRRPLNEIYGNSNNNFDNDKENHLNTSTRSMRHKSRSAKFDLRIDSLFHERDQFLGLCSKNRFYANPNYSEPWKVFSRISEKLAAEIVNSVEEDFTIGVSKFVQDFLELETQT